MGSPDSHYEDYYAVLEIECDADDVAIKRAYHKQAMRWHPDKNQENRDEAEVMFKAIAEAYDVLSDPDMRAIFDKYGEEVLKGEGSPGTPERHGTTDEDCGVMNRTNSSGRFHYVFNRDPEAMFANFFKGDTARRMRGLGFSDIFGGPDLDMLRKHMAPARKRAGSFTGSSLENVERVVEVKLKCTLEDLFLGTTQRFMVKRKNLTLNRPEEKLLEVPLRPGWKAGTKVTFEGEGDEYEPGYCQDLVFLLVESQHRRFTRAGSDLVHHSCIPLVDALTGFKVDVPTLDNRILRVSVKELVHPTFTKVLKGEGMPDSKLPGTRGDMVLTFDIIWPKNLDDAQKEAIRDNLPRS